MKAIQLLFLIAILVGCGGDKKEDPVPETGMDYLNEVLDVMQDKAVYKNTIDWPTLRTAVLAKAEADGAKSIEDVFPAIELALKSLGDNNSKYFAVNSTVLYGFAKDPCTGSSSTPDINDANIGYIAVTSITGGNSEQLVQYAVDMQTSIKNQDSHDMKGWIVDLRGNTGGNMLAMLGAIGPLLGNGVAGYFIDGDGVEQVYSYNNGVVTLAGAGTTYVADFYTPLHANQKVAILVDQRTAVSGEGIAISFMGRGNTRSFGVASCGLSTAIAPSDLSDGATLALAVAVMADRNKNKFFNGVIPDVVVTGDKEVVDEAIEWINEE